MKRREVERGRVPAAWQDVADAALRGRHGVGVGHLVDPEDFVTYWFAEGRSPYAAADLDAFDRTIATWLRGFKSARDYQRQLGLLARELGYLGGRPVRIFLERAAREPRVVEEQLARYIAAADRKSSTVRLRMAPPSTVIRKLYEAGLAERELVVQLPEKDVDTDVSAPSRRTVGAVAIELVRSASPMAARTHAILELALAGLRPKDLLDLELAHVHLEGGCVLVQGERRPIGATAVLALRQWFEARGHAPGPVFVGFDGRSGRLTDEAISPRQVQRVFAGLGKATGERLTPRSVRRVPIVEASSKARAAQIVGVKNVDDMARVRTPC